MYSESRVFLPVIFQVNLPTSIRSPVAGVFDRLVETTCASTIYPAPTASLRLSKSSFKPPLCTTPQKQRSRMSLRPHFICPSCRKTAKIYFLPNLGLREHLPRIWWACVASTFWLASSLLLIRSKSMPTISYQIDLQTKEAVFFPNARLVYSMSWFLQFGSNTSWSWWKLGRTELDWRVFGDSGRGWFSNSSSTSSIAGLSSPSSSSSSDSEEWKNLKVDLGGRRRWSVGTAWTGSISKSESRADMVICEEVNALCEDSTFRNLAAVDGTA